MPRRPLVVGNWKMNGSLPANAALVAGIASSSAVTGAIAKGVEVVVSPSPVHVAGVAAAIAAVVPKSEGQAAVQLGAQDVSEHGNGAFTGETSVAMLKEIGVRYVIIGHSERRSFFGDTDDRVCAKVKAALAGGLVPILCVGETLAEREGGNMAAVITRQIEAVIAEIKGLHASAYVIAYEPVWAIGTGKTASPEQAQEVHALIRSLLLAHGALGAADVRILYGGSVKAANAQSLFGQPDIDGGLIGGAALVAADFAAIVAAAA